MTDWLEITMTDGTNENIIHVRTIQSTAIVSHGLSGDWIRVYQATFADGNEATGWGVSIADAIADLCRSLVPAQKTEKGWFPA